MPRPLKPVLLALLLGYAGTMPLAAHATPAPVFTPATITIATTDGRVREISVRSVQQLKKAIQPCFGKVQCEEISVETCDRCFMTAEAVLGGYLIQSRLGPPGPLYDIIDDRPGRQNTATFGLKDLTTILVDYLTDRKTIPLAWRDTGQI